MVSIIIMSIIIKMLLIYMICIWESYKLCIILLVYSIMFCYLDKILIDKFNKSNEQIDPM